MRLNPHPLLPNPNPPPNLTLPDFAMGISSRFMFARQPRGRVALVRVGCDSEPTEILNNQRKLIWQFWGSPAKRFSDRPDLDISVPIC